MESADHRWADFSIRVIADPSAPWLYDVTFRQRRKPVSNPGQPHAEPQPDVTVSVQWKADGSDIRKYQQHHDGGDFPRREFENEARRRIDTLVPWVRRVTDLVGKVEQWSSELGWSTRRIEKTLEDSLIGSHQVSALIMQEGTCRMLLEPVGRTAPGVEGVVDLYRMPAYDDIASLYYYEGRWNLHYLFPDARSTATVREAASIPLSKEALQKVVEEMKQHAA